MSDKNTVPLSAPVTAHGKEVKILTLREPKGSDIMDFGYPVVMETNGKGAMAIKVDAKAAGELGGHLANIPPNVVRGLPLADFNALVGVVGSFFMESLKTLFSTVTSTSGGSSET
jgi:Phage tail assembly chaperone proteins, E, or 41 or 14